MTAGLTALALLFVVRLPVLPLLGRPGNGDTCSLPPGEGDGGAPEEQGQPLTKDQSLRSCYRWLFIHRVLNICVGFGFLGALVWIHAFRNSPTLDAAVTFSAFGVLTVLGLSAAAYSRRCLREAERLRQAAIVAYATEMERQAITDPLTGLFNRRYFFKRLQEEMVRAAAASSPLTLLMADVDGLKAINDRFGHLAGDEALRRVSLALRRSCRASDIPARSGGDEFAVLMPETDQAAALTVEERIRSLLDTLPIRRQEGEDFSVNVSVGVAGYPQDGQDVDSLVRSADAALYRRKALRRSRDGAAASRSP